MCHDGAKVGAKKTENEQLTYFFRHSEKNLSNQDLLKSDLNCTSHLALRARQKSKSNPTQIHKSLCIYIIIDNQYISDFPYILTFYRVDFLPWLEL